MCNNGKLLWTRFVIVVAPTPTFLDVNLREIDRAQFVWLSVCVCLSFFLSFSVILLGLLPSGLAKNGGDIESRVIWPETWDTGGNAAGKVPRTMRTREAMIWRSRRKNCIDSVGGVGWKVGRRWRLEEALIWVFGGLAMAYIVRPFS